MVLISSFGSSSDLTSGSFTSFSESGSFLAGLLSKSILPTTDSPDSLSAFASILSTFSSDLACSSFDMVMTVLSGLSIFTLSAFSFSNFSL